MFGDGCKNKCGSCANNTNCHHVTGTCLHGCELGYLEDDCSKSKLLSIYFAASYFTCITIYLFVYSLFIHSFAYFLMYHYYNCVFGSAKDACIAYLTYYRFVHNSMPAITL